MEFYEEVVAANMDVTQLKAILIINNLTKLCASIDEIISSYEDNAEIYCLWGSFNVKRDEIRNGVRLSLLNCPHALALTVTWHKEKNHIVIHCTIDSKDSDTDLEFIESIKIFVADWAAGLKNYLLQTQA